MKLRCSINGIEYDLVQGNTFSDEYNETLDSGTIIIDQVSMIKDLKPYDDVYIFDSEEIDGFYGYDENGNVLDKDGNIVVLSFFKHQLVDQFSEQIINLKDGIYKYKIQLFSETKKLETIQLPNISVTQPLNYSQKVSVYTYLQRFVSMYSPKYKKVSDTANKIWVYTQKYKVDTSLSAIFNSVYAPDFSLNNPNLRDVLSQLMLTKDMIPYVENDIIKGLDITQRNGTFDTTGVNYVNASRSSDNHCDNLKRTYSDALSQDNSCRRVEFLGFRNSDEAMLTLDNMRLETQFPIYKINKVYMCYYKKGKITYPSSETITKNISVSSRLGSLAKSYDLGGTISSATVTKTSGEGEISSYSFSGSTITISFNNGGTAVGERWGVYATITAVVSKADKIISFLCKQDITKLVKLDSEWQLLSQDWDSFSSSAPTTIEEMEKYKLCTVAYSIGSNYITGWGTKYEQPVGWWGTKNHTYIQNIYEVVDAHTPFGIYSLGYITQSSGIDLGDGSWSWISNTDVYQNLIIDSSFGSNYALFFKSVFFEIDYNAFYNGTVFHSKDFASGDITINDNSSSSLALLENDGLFEKEKANRFGNKAVTIQARYTNESQIQALGSVFEDTNKNYSDVIIYHREISYFDNCINVLYYGTQDYVLKNYFTSVYAKHRTYNLMSYGESVRRSENRKIIMLLSKDKYYYENNSIITLPSNFYSKIFSFFKSTKTPQSIDYIENTDKLDQAVITNSSSGSSNLNVADINEFVCGYSLCFNVSMYDNVSGGVYISNINPTNKTTEDDIKGSVQKWSMLVDSSSTGMMNNVFISMYHFNDRANYFNDKVYSGSSAITPNFSNIYNLPRFYSTSRTNEIKISDTIYKDNKEQLDMTLQFEPLTTDDNIMFTPLLMKLSDMNASLLKFNQEVKVTDSSNPYNATLIYSSLYRFGTDNTVYYPFIGLSFNSDVLDAMRGNSYTTDFIIDMHYGIAPTGVYNYQLYHYNYRVTGITVASDGSYIYLNGTETAENGDQVVEAKSKTTYLAHNQYPTSVEYTDGVLFISSRVESGEIPEYVSSDNIIKVNSREVLGYSTPFNPDKSLADWEWSTGKATISSDTAVINGVSFSVSSEANKTYLKNLYVAVSSNTLKKGLIYKEFKTIPSDITLLDNVQMNSIVSIGVDDYNRDYLMIEIPKSLTTEGSIQLYYYDNIIYERDNTSGSWVYSSDTSQAYYRLILAVNITEKDIANRYVKIYLSMITRRDMNVYSSNHILIGTNRNYADGNKTNENKQYYDIIE